ncbi:MAG: type II toxin-antitoxin system RelE/ParE family toxin [Tannerella sp.]|jgi:mRNA interferase RelE/StbE|nr:type II toxin-antitoxin system RelE/ParE family toxin [Tannerella sp.]
MNSDFAESFERDLKKIRDAKIIAAVQSAILSVEAAKTLHDIPQLKKLKTSKKGAFFRIKVGSYRIGISLENQTAVFIACGHRKDVYKYFP